MAFGKDDECIVFSDPRSKTRIQIATRAGEQGEYGIWLGTMKYTNLKVFNGQNRNSTATFTIFGYNTSDAIDQWMLPGIAVFVVRQSHLRFSGVISKVDGDYVGYDLSQTYRIMCESDANWLLNRTTCTKNGVAHKQVTAKTILMDVLDPDTMWYNNSLGTAMTNFNDTERIDYTISDKPALVQIQELASIAGMKYRTRTQSALGTAQSIGGGVYRFTKIRGDMFITATPSTIGKGSHNKWIAVLVWDGTYGYGVHTCAAAVTASTIVGTTDLALSSTDAINIAGIYAPRQILLIQHPILEFKPSFGFYTTKSFYINPGSSGGVLTQSPCWNYSPLAEKNDVITKVTADGMDGDGNPISIALAAAFRYDPSSRAFWMQKTNAERYVTQNYDNQNLIDTSLYPNKLQIYYDNIYGWGVGSTGHITQSSGGLYQEQFTVATITYTGEVIGGRKTVWLNLTGPLTYNYVAGDAVCPGGEGYAYVYVNDASFFVTDAYYWVGRELVKCMSIALNAAPGIIRVMRAIGFVSSSGYTTRTYAGPHKKYCPIMDGMPPDAAPTYSQKCFDRDDYFDVSSVYDAPIKTYGINTKHITVNKAVDAGTLELVCYNVLRNSCLPKYKGNLSCFIDALVDPLTPFNTMKPGDQFVVDYFGTSQPPSAVYEIMSLDMDFDSGTCVLQFDEYDISLMMALANMGLSINIT